MARDRKQSPIEITQISGTVCDVHRNMGHKSSFRIKITAVLEGYTTFEVTVKIAIF
jgi:hypothetical protein